MSKRRNKFLYEQQTRNEFTSSLAIPLSATIIGIIISVCMQVTIVEGLLISLGLGIYSSILVVSYNSISSNRKILISQACNRRKIEELIILSQIQKRLNSNKHPYFRKWGQKKILAFLDENEAFFNGYHETHPHAEDTYGIEGLRWTCSFGTLKCTSCVLDYWDGGFAKDYLKHQEHLIKVRGVKVQRIFFITDLEKMKPLFAQQHNMGIEVFYIFSDDAYLNKEWIQDFLIQDDKLLVQIFCDNHKFDENNYGSELITINPCLVEEKIEIFSRLLERATRFIPNPILRGNENGLFISETKR